jgi:hypothetical protein
MHIVLPSGKQIPLDLVPDSQDYHILTNGIKRIRDVAGMICEIGTYRGGSLQHIVTTLLQNQDLGRNMICIDPYGGILYSDTDTRVCRTDYTNPLKVQTQIAINLFLLDKPINVVFHCLEDTEFFDRYQDYVPFYNENKIAEKEYALVFFDGPHSHKEVMTEVEFFHPRSAVGAVWVFDDLSHYNHDVVEQWLFNNGWTLLEKGHKASYTNLV